MPLLRYTNVGADLLASDALMGAADSLCQKICLPAADQAQALAAVTLTLQRLDTAEPAVIGPLTVAAGRTAFGAELGQAVVNGDSLEPAAVQPVTARFEVPLTGLTQTVFGAECYVTVTAPALARRVQTWHALSPSGVFHECVARAAGTDTPFPYPLALTLTVHAGAAAGAFAVTSMAAADHDQFTTILAQGAVRRRSRITLWETDLGLASPPFRTAADLPKVANPVVLRQVRSYQATRTDRFNTGSFSMEVGLPEFEYFRSRFYENAMLTVDEQWSDGATRTPWLRRGVFFIDTVADSADLAGERMVTVAGRDALKLLLTTEISRRFWPDKLFVPRKRLTRLRDGFATGLPYHVYADGSVDPANPQAVTKTVMWADRPAPRFWRENDVGRRIPPARGSFDVLLRDGEVWIEREFYAAGLQYAGLGNPVHIEAQYWRYALPADEALTKVVGVGAAFLILAAPCPQAWRGVTVTPLSGAARHTRFQVTAVAPDGSRLFFTGQDLAGVAPGDLVQVVAANRLEDVVRQIMLACGFQDVDARAPFFIENVLPPPTANAVTLPADETFDFRYEQAKSGMEIMTQIGYWIPPNTRYQANPVGNVETVVFNPAAAPVYAARDTVGAVSQEKTDANLYTRIVYRVRNRRYLNLIGFTSPALQSWRVNDEPIGLAGLTMRDVLSLVPVNWLANLASKAERAIRAAADGVKGSGVEWRLVLDTDTGPLIDPPADRYRNHMDGRWLMEWSLDKLYKLKEIHIRGIDPRIRGVEGDWIKDQFMEIQISRDGALWETVTDEFVFDDAQNPYKQFTVADNTFAQHLRLLVTHAALVKTTRTRAQFFGASRVTVWSEAVTFADLFVYADDAIQGVAELGVDRFAGETDAQFARDQALRARLGARTLVVEPIDEQGYEISIVRGLTLEQYAKARALEFLAERVTEFNTVRLTGLRPDLAVGDLPRLALPQLSLPEAGYLIRETVTESTGTVQALGTDFRFAAAGSGPPELAPAAGTAPVLTQDVNRTDGGNDWAGYYKPG